MACYVVFYISEDMSGVRRKCERGDRSDIREETARGDRSDKREETAREGTGLI